jgi:catechol 2,3-dioxygenase-like lactoylglutathione lyase family enzyme
MAGMRILPLVVLSAVAAACACPAPAPVATASPADSPAASPEGPAKAPTIASSLGAFSVSLSVKDLAKSRAFYEHLGFKAAGGDPANGWQILRNGTTTIGLFRGMFEGNLLTFNPGWSANAEALPQFEDVRAVQERLEKAGITLLSKADPASTGVAHITVKDPDGNVVLIDQHVPKPK